MAGHDSAPLLPAGVLAGDSTAATSSGITEGNAYLTRIACPHPLKPTEQAAENLPRSLAKGGLFLCVEFSPPSQCLLLWCLAVAPASRGSKAKFASSRGA